MCARPQCQDLKPERSTRGRAVGPLLPHATHGGVAQRVVAVTLLVDEYELNSRADLVHPVTRNHLVAAEIVRPDLEGTCVDHALAGFREDVFRGLGDLAIHHVAERLVRYRKTLDLDIVRLTKLNPYPAAVGEHSPLKNRVV